MANIPLRAYEKKIEELIEQNHLPEAVAHCRHILKTFPKNISTYRILGKAFLEAKKYNETADVFKRVLTVFPDDFISHVGMSIIRENENNLDAAIWHMELAFDSQPSNITIQEELKRLFGRRDGSHPTKIRLTRGALVRMYARGELYQQAIAEINSALTEDIKRLDLEVFLAKMHYLSGDQSSALELCQKLTKEIPYCFEVNKILYETSQADKNNIFAGRLRDLDPYFAFVSPKFPLVDDIPDDKVTIEELSDSSLAEATRDSSWISNLDNSWDKPSFVPEPQSSAPASQTPAMDMGQTPVLNAADLFGEDKEPSLESIFEKPKTEETQPIESTQPNNWLHDLNGNTPDSASTSEVSQNESDQPPAEVPDWLRSLVPEDAASPQATTPSDEVASTFSEPENPIVQNDAISSSGGGVFEMDSAPAGGSTGKPVDNADLPDWLKNFDTEKSSEPVSQDDLPDWLNSLQTPGVKPTDAEPVSPAFEIPEETHGVVVSPAAIFSEEPAIPPIESTTIDSEITSPSFEASQELTQIQAEALPVEEAPIDTSTSEVPDWIRKLHETSDSGQIEQPEPEIESEPESTQFPEPVIPETVAQAASAAAVESLGPDQTISDQTSDELLEWLRDLKPEDSESLQGEGEVALGSTGNTDSLSYDFDAELSKLNQPVESEPQSVVQETAATQEASSVLDDTDDFLNRLTGVQPQVELIEEIETSAVEPALEKPIEEQPVAEETAPAASSFLDQFLQSTDDTTIPEEPRIPEIAPAPAAVAMPSDGDIQQLLNATQNKPDDYISWQKLGDAYAGTGRYTDALFAYSKAEQILINLI